MATMVKMRPSKTAFSSGYYPCFYTLSTAPLIDVVSSFTLA